MDKQFWGVLGFFLLFGAIIAISLLYGYARFMFFWHGCAV